MKKSLAPILLLTVFAFRSFSGVLINDTFSYADGNITNVSGGVWTNHSGAGGDCLVSGGKYQVDQNRQDDVNRSFNNADQYLWASFTLNLTTLPSSTSPTYFGHFKDFTTSNFLCRVFAVVSNTVVPGTYRVAIANGAGVPNRIFTQDMATGADYTVVARYDTVNFVGRLWLNPADETDLNFETTDTIAPPFDALSAFAWRQSTGEGVMTVDNLLVGNSFAEVLTGSPSAPAILVQPQGTTNYSGNDTVLYAVATGSGNLAYQWYRNGSALGGATSNVLALNNLSGSDDGPYQLIVTNSVNSATSLVAYVSVNTTPTAPIILVQPQNQTNTLGSPVTFSVTAEGTGPISYQWKLFGTNLPGATTSTYAIASVDPTSAGPYQVGLTNAVDGTLSQTGLLVVLPPIVTSIGYLRTLQDTSTWLPTNTTTLYNIEGVVTTHTNITTAPNMSLYMQDDTAGINVFFGGSQLRPNAGDRIRVIGPLGVFSSLLEMNLTTNSPNHSVEVLGSGNPMPVSKAFYFSQTNDITSMEQVYEGALVTITNVYFPAGGTGGTFVSGSNVTITNAAGQNFILRVDSRVGNIIGKPIPAFAHEVTGVMGQFQGNAALPRNNGYQIIPTRLVDIVTTLPPAFTIAGVRLGNNTVLTWNATNGSTYSVHRATDVAGPYARILFGLNFLNASGSYTENNTAGAAYYRLTTP